MSGIGLYDGPTYGDLKKSDWEQIVAKQRREGLTGLTTSERQILLTGAVKAYLALVGSARYAVHFATSDRVGSVLEVYSSATSSVATVRTDISQRAVIGPEVEAKLGAVPKVRTDAPDETRTFNMFQPDARVTTVEWSRRSDVWQCRTADQTGPYALIALARLALLEGIVAAPPGTESSVDGRKALAFSPIGSTRPINILIDEVTLLPIAYKYFDQSGAVTAQVTLTAVNQDASISTPGDASLCA